MTIALCLACGDTKFGAFVPCGSCEAPMIGGDIDLAFTDHYYTPDTLENFGRVIKLLRPRFQNPEHQFWAFIRYVSQTFPELLRAEVPDELRADVERGMRGLVFPKFELESAQTRREEITRQILETDVDPPSQPGVFGEWQLEWVYSGDSSYIEWFARSKKNGHAAIVRVPRGRGRVEHKSVDLEAYVRANLRHPIFARFLASGTTDGAPWVATEPVEAAALRELLPVFDRQPPRWRLETAIDFIAKLADAIDELNRARFADGSTPGLVHSSLAPYSVGATARGEPIILDVSLARLKGPKTGEHCAATYVHYFPPDYYRSIDHRDDVYALAALLYRMLTGVRPYEELDENQLMLGDRTPLIRPRVRASFIAPQLDTLLMQALDPNLSARPARGGELAKKLRAMLGPNSPDHRQELGQMVRDLNARAE